MSIKVWFGMKEKFYVKILIFVLLITCISPCVVGQPFSYKFNYLTVDEGLSHTDANDIAQDKYGYIWVATYFGINRFDGYSIKKYYNTNVPIKNAFKNRITCISPDDAGNIWLGSEDGLQCFYPKTEQYIDFTDPKNNNNPGFGKIFKPAGNWLYGITGDRIRLYAISGNTINEQQLNLPADTRVRDMVPDENGLLYLATNKGVLRLDKNGTFKKIIISGLTDENLTRVFINSSNNLVVASSNKMFLLGKKTAEKNSGTTEYLVDKSFVTDKNAFIKDISENTQLDYWLNTGAGLLRLDTSLKLIQFVTNKSSQQSLYTNSISKAFIDRSHCLWVCTFGGGLNYCDLNQKLFYTLRHNPEIANSLSGNHIRSILEDGDDLWIGTTANGLNLYHLKQQNFTHYNTYNSQVKLKDDVITSLTFDDDHNLWIGSGRGIEILRPNKKDLWKPPGYDQFPTYVIETLAKDCFGNIWFGNHMNRYGVIWKDKQNYYQVKYYDEGFFILPDKIKPQLFISSTNGLKRVTIDAEGNINHTFRYHASAHLNSISSNYTYPIGKLNDSTYWIGTIGGGLNRMGLNEKDNTYTIKSYAGKQGVFNDVESLEIDNDGNIWMGGNGLERLDPVTEKLIRYDKNDGLQGNSFKVGSSYKGADGRLYFGGINGLNYFFPEQIQANKVEAQPVLTDILINNQKPDLGTPDSSVNYIAEAIGYGKEVQLNYLQNNFVIYFSAMHFANPLKCKYRYKLIGFDKDWKYTDGKKPGAAYNNLDYSSYKFVVEATNDDGIWSKTQAETYIVITPPWWKSGLAKLIYFLLIASGLAGIYIYQAKWYGLKSRIAVNAVNENKREEMHKHKEELYQQQLMFFTNISHEFRTPLTLILGPLERLFGQNKNAALDSAYQLMFKNSKRLINLISELMNFKKIADSKIKLQVRPLVINQFCKDLVSDFQNLATGKDIDFMVTDYTAENSDAPLTGFFDIQILEKILFNLLNNAFKYTHAGERICFEIFFDIENFKPSFDNGFQLLNEEYRAKEYIYFRISDTGIGIAPDALTRIFDMYYRISSNQMGSGVGLTIVKSLTQLHKGDIYIYSEQNRGTEIIIGIPWGEENYAAAEKSASNTAQQPQLEAIDNAVLLPLPDYENDHPQSISKMKKRILLVDDNQELRAFLKQALGKTYFIYEAENGIKALEIAAEKIPDLIISDVMMPVMDGIAFCKLTKERFETRHIPFIILSAKDALATKIEGMESGADFYFAKPLSIELLLLTVHNIFEQGEKLKQRYTNDYLAEATELVHSEKDKAFFNQLLNLIEENIQDPDLDVDYLCEKLFISRTKLYQKIKSISDQSVGEFIRTIRLKKAIQIMTHENIAINEVVDRIGLQSSSNFSRAFKKEYGKSPMQFMQSLKNYPGRPSDKEDVEEI